VESAVEPDRARLRNAIEAAFALHTDPLLGSLTRYARAHDEAPLIWRFGFIHRVELRSVPMSAQILREVFAHASGQFVAELFLAGSDPRDLLGAIVVVVTAAPKTLRSLAIESSLDLGTLERLFTAVPNLRFLAIDAHDFEARNIELPVLESAAFDGRLSALCLRALAEARWPRLKHLGLTYTGGSATAADLAPLFDRTDLTHLKYLGLRGFPFGAAICRRLPHARFTHQLLHIDLLGCELDDADAAALAAHPARFHPNLTLTVPTGELSSTGLAALRVLDPKLRR
ncbi:MAG: hypothetical protein H0T79_08480, partial [Deltaproteobacteria bacterium]|nr:hypothetical protein [Deltaproteobacteria bacterium]